jgi:hypothetical protein
MRPMLAVTAGVSILLLASGAGWAGGRARQAESSKDKEAAPASFNRTFQWEEKELGPKDKGVDHNKIAAMQERARQEDAAKRREPPKKPEHTAGVNGPASSVIPTQDIEKAHEVRTPVRKASYTPPKQRDAIDNVLAENGVGSSDDSGREGLGKVFASSPKHKPAKHAAKHARARHRR